MKFLLNELNKINDEDLSKQDLIKKKYFKKLIHLLSYLPIEDAHNFKKIYDIYKVEKIDLNQLEN